MNIAAFIDHTLLKPTATLSDIEKLCEEAKMYRFAAVCVPPFYVKNANAFLYGSDVKIATVIGFPFGYQTTFSKLQEIKEAIDDGADELDMVINLAVLKSGNWNKVQEEVKACAEMIHTEKKLMKLIVESGVLTDEELILVCGIVSENKVDFIKTSTGYAETGATIHAVEIMKKNIDENIRIKASGGICTFKFAKELIIAGADRLGCSASVQILKEHYPST